MDTVRTERLPIIKKAYRRKEEEPEKLERLKSLQDAYKVGSQFYRDETSYLPNTKLVNDRIIDIVTNKLEELNNKSYVAASERLNQIMKVVGQITLDLEELNNE